MRVGHRGGRRVNRDGSNNVGPLSLYSDKSRGSHSLEFLLHLAEPAGYIFFCGQHFHGEMRGVGKLGPGGTQCFSQISASIGVQRNLHLKKDIDTGLFRELADFRADEGV